MQSMSSLLPFPGMQCRLKRARAHCLPVGLLLVLVCTLLPSLSFMAPPPSNLPRTPLQRASVYEQGKPFASHPVPASNGSPLPWTGLGISAALLLLASTESAQNSRTILGALTGPRDSSATRVNQTPMRESATSMTPASMLHQEAGVNDATKSDSSGAWKMAFGFFCWYAANVAFNIVNKQALGLFPHAWSVSVVQLAMVVACSSVGWASGLIESPWKSMNRRFLWRLLPAALCHALGNGLTSVAFSWGSVSFTHVIKTSEPVWMALGTLMLNGTKLPRPQLLALIPIMLGVALASAGELSFTWIGFLAALGSTICFAGRGIFSKRLMSGGEKMSPLNVYAMDSLMALAFTLPMAALADGAWIAGGGLGSLFAAGQGLSLITLLSCTGLAYYAYNAIAFNLLDKLDVVSHAVGNLGKRIFVIGFSVVAFHNPLTMRAAAGSIIAIAGSGLYSYVKATTGKKSVKPTGLKAKLVGLAGPALPRATV